MTDRVTCSLRYPSDNRSSLNAAARLIARLPPWSHISPFMFHHLHWLPLTARIQLKILTLIYRSYSGYAPKYLRDLIRLPISATSLRPLRSPDRHDLFVPRVRTATAIFNSSFCLHWPCTMEPALSIDTLCSTNRWSKYLFPLS